MAIKGKRRPRGRRVVAAPPRPPLMVRRRALWQQRWFWIGLGVLAAAGIVLGVLLTMRSNDRKHDRVRRLAAAQNYSTAVQNALPDDRTAVAPDVIIPFASFRQTLDDLSGGKGSATAKKDAVDVANAATKAASDIGTVDTATLVPREFTDLRAALNDSKNLFVQSFRLYADAAKLVEEAADLPTADRKAILTTAGDVLSRASLLFQSGVRKMAAQVNGNGGTFQPVQPPAPSPSPSPSVSPTPSAPASVSPSTSPSA
jgi:hypothetical protein